MLRPSVSCWDAAVAPAGRLIGSADGATTIATLSFKRKRKMFYFLSFRWWKERQFVQSAEDAVTRTIHMVCLDRSIGRPDMHGWLLAVVHTCRCAGPYGHIYICTRICMVLESGECRAWPPYVCVLWDPSWILSGCMHTQCFHRFLNYSLFQIINHFSFLRYLHTVCRKSQNNVL